MTHLIRGEDKPGVKVTMIDLGWKEMKANVCVSQEIRRALFSTIPHMVDLKIACDWYDHWNAKYLRLVSLNRMLTVRTTLFDSLKGLILSRQRSCGRPGRLGRSGCGA